MSSGYDVIDCGAAYGVNRECAIVVAAIGPLGSEYSGSCRRFRHCDVDGVLRTDIHQGDCGVTTLCVVSRIRDFTRISHLSKRLTPY